MQLATIFDRTVFLEPAFLKWHWSGSYNCQFIIFWVLHHLTLYMHPLFVKWTSSFGKINWHTRTTEHRTLADQWKTNRALADQQNTGGTVWIPWNSKTDGIATPTEQQNNTKNYCQCRIMPYLSRYNRIQNKKVI